MEGQLQGLTCRITDAVAHLCGTNINTVTPKCYAVNTVYAGILGYWLQDVLYLLAALYE